VLPFHGELQFLNNSQAAALQHPEYVHQTFTHDTLSSLTQH